MLSIAIIYVTCRTSFIIQIHADLDVELYFHVYAIHGNKIIHKIFPH